jgi:hypothetical protein
MTRTETLKMLKARQSAQRRNAKAIVAAAKAGDVARVQAVAQRERAQHADFWGKVRG